MTHGQQPAGRADRAAPANIQPAALQQPGRPALGAQAHGFDVQQLLNAERVVEFDDVEIGRRDTRLAIRLGDRLARQLGVEVCRPAVHPLGPQGRGQNPDGSGPLDAQPFDGLGRGDNDRSRALANRAALQAGQ